MFSITLITFGKFSTGNSSKCLLTNRDERKSEILKGKNRHFSKREKKSLESCKGENTLIAADKTKAT